jgi:2-dehydropantoate 2-reductase
MRIAVVGTGALGSLIANAFCMAGNHVTLVDLPQRLEQISALGGLVVIGEGGEQRRATPAGMATDMADAGRHDVVFLATKAFVLPSLARRLATMVLPDGFFVTLQNGIPWWYLSGLDHELGGRRLRSLDPDGVLAEHIDPTRIIGCVAYPAAILRTDGVVQHVEGLRFPVGELDGVERDRTRELSRLFEDAGFKSRVLTDIRSEIWLKAWGALSINPISALTRATMADVCSFAPTRALVAEMMREAQAIGEALGATFRHPIEKRIEGARAVGQHKTSMLQDVEANRRMELDAVMGAILELAELTGCRADAIRTVHACAALLNEQIAGQGGA